MRVRSIAAALAATASILGAIAFPAMAGIIPPGPQTNFGWCHGISTPSRTIDGVVYNKIRFDFVMHPRCSTARAIAQRATPILENLWLAKGYSRPYWVFHVDSKSIAGWKCDDEGAGPNANGSLRQFGLMCVIPNPLFGKVRGEPQNRVAVMWTVLGIP